MNIFPAIDIIDGKVVRLFQGDYQQKTIYSENPREIAEKFKEAGASHLHVVDLDGAKGGKKTNFDTIESIVRDLGMFVEVGGGIRSEERIAEYLNIGVSQVILGTIAYDNPGFLDTMLEKYGSHIAVGVDARDGKVAINGWKEVTDQDSFEFCEELYGKGVSTIICTDISKDGAEQGTNLEAYKRILAGPAAQGKKLTASGGISSYEELEKLRDMGVYGAIIGKAMYTESLDLSKCIEKVK